MSFQSNFAFFEEDYPEWAKHGKFAEKNLEEDPNTTLFKCRLLGELMLRQAALVSKVRPHSTMAGTEKVMVSSGNLDRATQNIFRRIRAEGNVGVHQGTGQQALLCLKMTHLVACWYMRKIAGVSGFNISFQVPPPQSGAKAYAKLLNKVATLMAELEDALAPDAETRPTVFHNRALAHSFERIPDQDRKLISAAINQFSEEPGEATMERDEAIADPHIHLVKFKHPYVLVVGVMDEGDTLLLMWVGEKKGARRWAKTKCIERHPELMTYQVYDTSEGIDVGKGSDRLFDLPSADLRRCGVPVSLVPVVSEMRSRIAFEGLTAVLPQEAVTCLRGLLIGLSLLEAQKRAGIEFDDDGYPINIGSVSGYAPVTRKDELLEILERPLDDWRRYLHPDQKRLVSMHAKGAVRVLGGAGTGKTVVLLHRAVHLAQNVFTEPDHRILVTTYTKSLAANLDQVVDTMMTPAARQRIHVVNLHALVSHICASRGFKTTIIGSDTRDKLLRTAISDHNTNASLSLEFFKDEWSLIVQRHNPRDWDAYRRISRRGRGTSIRGRTKRAVWNVLKAFRDALANADFCEFVDQVRHAKILCEAGALEADFQYCAVLADEVQDFGAEELRLLRALAGPTHEDVPPNALFMVGDPHQRIYEKPIVFSRVGINIVGRSRKLRLNYRTTEEIRRCATNTLEGQIFFDLDGEKDDLHGYESLRLGKKPLYALLANSSEEAEFIVAQLQTWLETHKPEEICISVRNRGHWGKLKKRLKAEQIAFAELKSDITPTSSSVRMATMHNMKGLEFKCVLLMGVNDGSVPPKFKSADKVSAADRERQERSIFYVAATRARDDLVITGHGKPSRFVTVD